MSRWERILADWITINTNQRTKYLTLWLFLSLSFIWRRQYLTFLSLMVTFLWKIKWKRWRSRQSWCYVSVNCTVSIALCTFDKFYWIKPSLHNTIDSYYTTGCGRKNTPIWSAYSSGERVVEQRCTYCFQCIPWRGWKNTEPLLLRSL